MKKALIPALLIAAALTPSLRNAVEFPPQTFELARAFTCPIANALFWNAVGRLADRENAQPADATSQDDDHCFYTSILQYFVRRMNESPVPAVSGRVEASLVIVI